MDRLEDLFTYMADAAEAQPELVGQGKRGIGAILSEGFLRMSRECHQPGDQAELPPKRGRGRPKAVTPAQALVLVKEAGSLRLAAQQTGISKSALQRALQQTGGTG